MRFPPQTGERRPFSRTSFQGLFARFREQAEEAGVPIRELYSVTTDISDIILDIAATFAVDQVILGATRRSALWRTMKGDVIQGVAAHLPERTSLLIRT